MHQLPLVLFTVCIQAATGLLLFSGLLTLCAPQNCGRAGASGAPDEADTQGRAHLVRPLPFMWVLLVLGMAASFLHLGKPLNALHTLRGFANGSPMSVEIVCILVFGLLTLLYTLCFYKDAAPALRRGLLALSMLAAVGVSYAVANVYAIATIPVWNSLWTFAVFFMSVLALGCVGVLAFPGRHPRNLSASQARRWHMLALVILLALIACTALYLEWTGAMLGAVQGRAGAESTLPLARLCLQGLALFLLVLAGQKEGQRAAALYPWVFVCVLGSELAGRLYFYNLQYASGALQFLMY